VLETRVLVGAALIQGWIGFVYSFSRRAEEPADKQYLFLTTRPAPAKFSVGSTTKRLRTRTTAPGDTVKRGVSLKMRTKKKL
jgi:hypothetical protein